MAGEDGIARFRVPDIAPVTIVVDAVEEEHPVRIREWLVRRVGIEH